MAKKPRPRLARRQAERVLAKVRDARDKLFALEVGGSAERPLSIASAAVVETHAESLSCPSCEGRQRVAEHVAVTHDGVRLREAKLICRQCGSRRSFWFRITSTEPN